MSVGGYDWKKDGSVPTDEKFSKLKKNPIDIGVKEIAAELKTLQERNDVKGMKRLFSSYLGWEKRNYDPSSSTNSSKNLTVEELAMKNFYTIAKIADEMPTTITKIHAIDKALKNGSQEGALAKFFRESVGYEPPSEPKEDLGYTSSVNRNN